LDKKHEIALALLCGSVFFSFDFRAVLSEYDKQQILRRISHAWQTKKEGD